MPRTYGPRYYKLIGTLVVPVDDIMEWSRIFNANRHVGVDKIGGAVVSTVFLGLDHGFLVDDEDALPIVFETMIFPTDVWDDYQTRCSTYEQALAMHRAACALVRKAQRQLPVIWQEVEDP